jgi:hypothetical protein
VKNATIFNSDISKNAITANIRNIGTAKIAQATLLS